jgi:hypothetical protein
VLSYNTEFLGTSKAALVFIVLEWRNACNIGKVREILISVREMSPG